MEDGELLERQVAVVATLGTVVAAVTGQHRDVRQRVSPKFLHAALRNFTWNLRKTLDHGDVTSLVDSGVPSLGQALAAFEPTSGASWDNVRAAAKAWRELVFELMESWKELAKEATKLRDACVPTAPARDGDPQDEATHRGTAGDSLAATAQRLLMALDREEVASARATRDAREAAATDEEEAAKSEEELAQSEEEAAISEEEVATSEAMGEAMVAASQARVDTRRGLWAEAALEPLKRLVAACGRATLFLSDLQWLLNEFEADVEWAWAEEESPNVPEALVAEVAEFEQLWDASACLAEDHLLGILELIDNILLSPYAGPGGPGGPGSRAVAEWCQRAIEDIPRLLRGQ